MRRKVTLLFIIPALLLLCSTSKASHLMGGEITWECLSTGKYVFHMIVYRDCAGIDDPSTATISTGGGCPVPNRDPCHSRDALAILQTAGAV